MLFEGKVLKKRLLAKCKPKFFLVSLSVTARLLSGVLKHTFQALVLYTFCLFLPSWTIVK
jgi:hypothetical protein